MSHAETADRLLIKPEAGARPASPRTRGRIIPQARTRLPVTRRVTRGTETPGWRRPQTDRLSRVSQSPKRSGDIARTRRFIGCEFAA
jgi:hypothetical protein